MIILPAIGLVLLLVGIGWTLLMRGRRTRERQAVVERRVEAYMQTIRREGGDNGLAAMTEVELRDLLLSSARNLKVQAERRWYLMVGGAAAVFVGAILVGTQDGTRGFVIALAVGGAALYGLNEWLARRMREPFAAQGIDVERLRVE